MLIDSILPRRGAGGLLALAVAMGLAGGPARADSVIEGQDGWLFPGWESVTEVDQKGIDASIELIRTARDQLEKRKIGLVVLVVPAKAPFYAPRLPADRPLGAGVSDRYGRIVAALERAGIVTLDAAKPLRAVEKGRQTAFLRADYHWTAWGSEAAADAVAKAIDEYWKLEGKPGGGSKLGEWVTERRFGDLATNFLSAERREAVGRDTYTVRVPVTGGGLLDDTPAPVTVIGNSFVQPYFGFPQKLSHDLDRPVALLWHPGTIGPWATFCEWMESPAPAAGDTRVVVWQFNEAQVHLGPDATGQWDAKSIMPPEAWRSRILAAGK